MIVVIENAAIIEQSKAYQVARTVWQVMYILEIKDEAFRVVFKA